MLEHTVRTASDGIWNILNIYRTMICTGSRNDSGMGMSFTWHGSGMERLWNGYGTAYGTKWAPAFKNKLPVCFSDSLARASNGMVWYGESGRLSSRQWSIRC